MSNIERVQSHLNKIKRHLRVSIYRCKEDFCGRTTNLYNMVKGACGEHACPYCGGEMDYSHQADSTYVGIAAYDIDRKYGGPEEGGWHYDEGNVIKQTLRCYNVNQFEELLAYHMELHSRFGRVKGKQIILYPDTIPPSRFPEDKPIYE